MVLFALTVSLVGCAGWRPMHQAEVVAPPDSYNNTQVAGDFNDSQWWTDFQDSTLNGIMDEMFGSNLSLQQSAARYEQFRQLYKASNSSWFPSLSGTMNIQESGDVGDPAPFNPMGQVMQYDASLSTRYEVDFWGRLSSNRNAAYEDLMASENDLRTFILSISAQTVRTYYGIVALRYQLNLSSQTVESYVAYLDLVRSRYERGITSSLDVYQAQINLASAQSRHAQLEANVATAEHALSVMLSRYPDENWFASDKLLPQDLNEIGEGIPSELIQRRPDVQSALHRIQAADRRWAEAVASRFPSFSLTARMGGSSDDLSDALNPDAMVWNAVGSLVVPIFQGGRLLANSERAEAGYDEQLARYKETVLNAFREVEDALVRGQKQLITVAELEKQAEAAGNLLTIATDRYLQGLTSYLQVVNAQTAYFNASSGLISARRDLIETRIGLITALGGSWTDEYIN